MVRGAAVYLTKLAMQDDVPELCRLENEFVEDHKQMLHGEVPEHQVFEQIGLDADAVVRTRIVTAIARPRPKVRYTLACSSTYPTRQIVGYVHFQLVSDRRPCIRIFYLKVSNSFQRQGVGTLLLASVLQLAEREILSLPWHVCLSVLSSNSRAIAFYRELGFVGGGGEGARWLRMRRVLRGPRERRAVRERWLDLAQGTAMSASKSQLQR